MEWEDSLRADCMNATQQLSLLNWLL